MKLFHTLTFKIRILNVRFKRLVAAEDAVINTEFQLILTLSSALKEKVNPFFGQSLKYKSNRMMRINLWS